MSKILTGNMTSKGQVTIPAAMRQNFGFKVGAAVEFFQAGSYVGVRPVQHAAQAPKSGFGMIKAKVKQVPADFDVASLSAKSHKNTQSKPA
ncbi:MAG: AbrB/MazE/SpoVT family DNA-binding domain-containing protein [Polaromonas sp.]|nr:MAG: AbrB/MazE/SpoVT family DNA-binding domain-containing protein [Polaromonas sp.]